MLQHSLAVLHSGAVVKGCHNLWVTHAHREEDEVIKTCRMFVNH